MIRALALPLLLALAACGGAPADQNAVESLDAELTEGVANGQDPMLTAALQDQIMVDPTLAAKANADAVRPPPQPYSAPVPSPDVAPARDDADGETTSAPAPSGTCTACAAARESLTLGALAANRRVALGGRCSAKVAYGAGWANRLTPDLPLHPAARVAEAAGANGPGCAIRLVSFTVARPMQAVLDWYYTRATRAGFSAEHQTDADGRHVLGGTRKRDGAAYMLFLTDRPGGTAVDYVANTGA